MELQLKRYKSNDKCTHGNLYIDGVFECMTLEDPVRDKKIKGKTAIPEGAYKIIIDWSPRFKRPLPLICNVPNFTGIRIHQGNSSKDTDGCILVGKSRANLDQDWINSSALAFNALFVKLEKARDDIEEIFITIKNFKLKEKNMSDIKKILATKPIVIELIKKHPDCKEATAALSEIEKLEAKLSTDNKYGASLDEVATQTTAVVTALTALIAFVKENYEESEALVVDLFDAVSEWFTDLCDVVSNFLNKFFGDEEETEETDEEAVAASFTPANLKKLKAAVENMKKD